jgi:hypothetical protein
VCPTLYCVRVLGFSTGVLQTSVCNPYGTAKCVGWGGGVPSGGKSIGRRAMPQFSSTRGGNVVFSQLVRKAHCSCAVVHVCFYLLSAR